MNEIIDQNPKFIALVEQNLKLDGEFKDYKFVYSSKHNFFKMITREVEKKKSLISVSLFKKKISVPEEISDENISENEFIETILDHCKYAPIKNVKNPDSNKKIIFKKFDTCKVKYLNTKKFDDMTLDTFAKLEKQNKVPKKKEKENKKKMSQNKKVEKKIKKNNENKKDLRVAFMWQKLPYPIISNLKMNDENSGILDIFLYETKDECIGTVALNTNNNGNWSVSCPDNKKRTGVFKKKLGASGTITVKNDVLIGKGYDTYRNKVEFIVDLH